MSQNSFTFFFQTCLPVQQPSCAKNELKSVVLRWQQDQNFILQCHTQAVIITCHIKLQNGHYIQGAPKQTAQSLMQRNFQTMSHEIILFHQKRSEINWQHKKQFDYCN